MRKGLEHDRPSLRKNNATEVRESIVCHVSHVFPFSIISRDAFSASEISGRLQYVGNLLQFQFGGSPSELSSIKLQFIGRQLDGLDRLDRLDRLAVDDLKPALMPYMVAIPMGAAVADWQCSCFLRLA